MSFVSRTLWRVSQCRHASWTVSTLKPASGRTQRVRDQYSIFVVKSLVIGRFSRATLVSHRHRMISCGVVFLGARLPGPDGGPLGVHESLPSQYSGGRS